MNNLVTTNGRLFTGKTELLLDEVMGTLEVQQAKSACPVLIVCIGGSGCEIGRRVKSWARWVGMTNFARFLAIDTDEASRAPVGSLPGFTNSEFCHLRTKRVSDVLNNPDEHKLLADRLDLGNSARRSLLSRIMKTKVRQAGQIRLLGLLSLYANYAAFRKQLTAAVSDLTGRWKSLEEQLSRDEAVKIENRFYTIVLGSPCGGTGSGIVIDVAAALQNELYNRDAEMSLFLTLPSVFEEKLRGKPDELERVQANTVATLRELDMFEHGIASELRIELGSSMETAFKAPVGLFERIYLVERTDAEGFDLETMDNVYDTTALHVLADIGSTIGGRIAISDSNDLARQGLAICPQTKKQRLYSTIGATALAIPIKRLVRYCVFHQLTNFVNSRVLGPSVTIHEVEPDVNRWLIAAELEERNERDNADNVINRLKAQAIPSYDGIVNKLYKHKTATGAVHFTDRDFAPKYEAVRVNFHDTDVPRLTEELSQQRDPMLAKARKDLTRQVNRVVAERGLRGASVFVQSLQQVFRATARELTDEIGVDTARATSWDQNTKAALKPLTTFIGKWGTDKAKQNEVVLRFRRAVGCMVNSELKRSAAWLMTQLASDTGKILEDLRNSMGSTEEYLREVETHAMENRPQARGVTTECAAEIDVSSPSFFENFLGRHEMDNVKLLESLTQAVGQNPTATLKAVGRDGQVTGRLVTMVATHFIEKLGDLNIIDVLDEQLSQGGEVGRAARARVEEALSACRPLWQAEIGVLKYHFADSIIVGLPEHMTDRVQENLDDCVDAAKASLNQDARYQADVDFVPTNDPHRIYALRRSHGGRLHYLQSWEPMRRAYDAFNRKDAHPVHIFPQSIVDKIPATEPIKGATEGELAWTIGMAYGFIAKRGPYYYFNLEKQERRGKSDTFVVPLNSHSNCITFSDGEARKEQGAVQELIDRGELRFGKQKDADRKRRLGDRSGRETALKEFSQSSTAVKLVFEVFDTLRVAAGDAKVSRELQEYMDSIPARMKPDDTHYEQIMREVELLRQYVDQLQSAA